MFGLMQFLPSAPVAGTVGSINSTVGVIQAVLGVPITNSWDAATIAAANKIPGVVVSGAINPAGYTVLGLHEDDSKPYLMVPSTSGDAGNRAQALIAAAPGGEAALGVGATAASIASAKNAAPKSAKSGMSSTEEDALIVGGIVVVGAIITYVVMKRRGKFSKKHGKSRR